jgi:hypothetical protein
MTVFAHTLGKCEHCGKVFTIEGLPAEAIDAQWHCRSCDGELTNVSMGFELKGESDKPKWVKTRWVGPGGEWQPTAPMEEFVIGSFKVVPGALSL